MPHCDNTLPEVYKGSFCPYCNCGTELVSDKEIYGPQANYGGMYYRCLNNKDHYVGTYADNITSLGRLADRELRPWKSLGHALQDVVLELNIFSHTPQIYNWLSHRLEIDRKHTHFGMFDITMCKKAIALLVDKITDPDIAVGRYVDDFGVIYSADKSRLIDAHHLTSNSYSLLPETRIICSGAFHHMYLKHIDFNQGLQFIGRESFNRCSSWAQMIDFPDSLEYISAAAFSSCWEINANFSKKIKYIGAWAFWDTLFMCSSENNGHLYERFGKEIISMPEVIHFQ